MTRTHTLLGCVAAAAGILPVVAGAQTDLASGTFGGSTYTVVGQSGVPWPSASAAAMDLSDATRTCHLATLTSASEDAFVENLRVTAGVSPGEVWVGGEQDDADNWTWVNGEGPFPGGPGLPGGYENWQDGEPNDAGGSEVYLGIGLGGPGWNDEANLGNIGGYVVECDAIEPGEDVTVFPPNIPDQPVVSVVQEVIAPGRIDQFTCVIKEPRRRGRLQGLNLIREIKNTHTPDCQALAAQLRPEYRARLRFYQRAFVNPDSTDSNPKDIVVTLVRSQDLAGNPADLTNGVVVSEEVASAFGVNEQECRITSTSAVDAGDSPTTVRANVDGDQFIDQLATNSTFFCNRSRSASRYSDQLYAYPIRNSDRVIGGPAQVATEATEFRLKLLALGSSCTDTAIVDRIRSDFDAAMLRIQFGSAFNNETLALQGISKLEATTLLALETGEDLTVFSYDGCPDLEGEAVSRLLAITFQSWRYILFPDAGDPPYEVPMAIEDLLPPFPEETPIP